MTTEYVETRMVLLDDLTPYPGNARRGDRARLVESLEANGQYRSLIVRETGDGALVVLAGNNTLAALAARGDDEARCEIITCDDDTARRVNLVDNRSNDLASYDRDALAVLLRGLDGDLYGTGYTEADLDRYLPVLETEVPSLDDLEEQHGAHEDADLWPVLRVRISPADHERFLSLTEGETPEDRFVCLLDRAEQ